MSLKDHFTQTQDIPFWYWLLWMEVELGLGVLVGYMIWGAR